MIQIVIALEMSKKSTKIFFIQNQCVIFTFHNQKSTSPYWIRTGDSNVKIYLFQYFIRSDHLKFQFTKRYNFKGLQFFIYGNTDRFVSSKKTSLTH